MAVAAALVAKVVRQRRFASFQRYQASERFEHVRATIMRSAKKAAIVAVKEAEAFRAAEARAAELEVERIKMGIATQAVTAAYALLAAQADAKVVSAPVVATVEPIQLSASPVQPAPTPKSSRLSRELQNLQAGALNGTYWQQGSARRSRGRVLPGQGR